jgi:hypothetical protein
MRADCSLTAHCPRAVSMVVAFTALVEAGSAASAGVAFVALVVVSAALGLEDHDLLADPDFEPGLAADGLVPVGEAAGGEVGAVGGAGHSVLGLASALGATTTTLIIPIAALPGMATHGSTRVTATMDLLNRSFGLLLAIHDGISKALPRKPTHARTRRRRLKRETGSHRPLGQMGSHPRGTRRSNAHRRIEILRRLASGRLAWRNSRLEHRTSMVAE